MSKVDLALPVFIFIRRARPLLPVLLVIRFQFLVVAKYKRSERGTKLQQAVKCKCSFWMAPWDPELIMN